MGPAGNRHAVLDGDDSRQFVAGWKSHFRPIVHFKPRHLALGILMELRYDAPLRGCLIGRPALLTAGSTGTIRGLAISHLPGCGLLIPKDPRRSAGVGPLLRSGFGTGRYPRGLSTSSARIPSVTTVIPPQGSICIISDVPERGKPETIVISDSSDISKLLRLAEQ